MQFDTQYWNGYCPECMLKDKRSRLMLNRLDFFDCEECALQMAIPCPGVQAVVMNFRGKHNFHSSKTYADAVENGELLFLQTLEMFPFCGVTPVQSVEELQNFIREIKD